MLLISAHVHGTIWIDTKKMETLYFHEDGHWTDLVKLVGNSEEKIEIKVDTRKALKNFYQNGYADSSELMKIIKVHKNYLQDQEDYENSQENPEEFVKQFVNHFPLFGLDEAFKKFKTNTEIL